METALKHWHGTACLVGFQLMLPHGEHPSYDFCTSSQMEETSCNAYSGRMEGGKRHSCPQQQQGLDDEGFNLIYGPNSNADHRPLAKKTNVRKLCTLGASQTQ